MAAEGATFYYDTNSPYGYLAAQRIGELIPDATWRPVAIAVIFRRIGKVPWSLKPGSEEGQAEVERRAAERGLPPVAWPAGTWSFAPLRAAILAERHDALVPFTLECYRLMFVEGRSLAEPENVLAAGRAAGLDAGEVSAALDDPEIKDQLRRYTDEAIERGAVGVPTVAVGDELFWGDDRLEEAAAAAAS